jgi:hypothetical protein
MSDSTTPRNDGVCTGELSSTKDEHFELKVDTNGDRSALEAQVITIDYALERKLVRKLDVRYFSRLRLI